MNTHTHRNIVTAAFALMLGILPASAAITVFDNLNNSFIGYGAINASQTYAFQFTSDADYNIDSVTLQLSGNQPATILLVDDLAGLPGTTTLQSFDFVTPAISGTASPTTFAPTSIYTLAAGATYHIVMSGTGVETWLTLDPTNTGTGSTDFKIENFFEGAWIDFDNIQMLAQITASPIPEPSIGIFSLIAGTFLLRRKRN
jgi:hypothetical protein